MRGKNVQIVPGTIYGRLTVIKRAANDSEGKAQWKCRCRCGITSVVRQRVVARQGSGTSCGCFIRELVARVRPDGMDNRAIITFNNSWRAAVCEAASLLGLEMRGCVRDPARIKACNRNCRDISDVLTIPAVERQALRAFVEANPEEHEMVVGAVVFRQMVCSAVAALRAQEVAA